tara:strand:+ start:830 stop:1144 length:315 start_codon:yes stop_codon:yes gene_type:complete
VPLDLIVKDSGLPVVAVDLQEEFLHHQHMVGVEVEHQETVLLLDLLLVVETDLLPGVNLDFKIPVVAVEEVKEVQHHLIHSIQVVEVVLVSSSSHTQPDKYLKT